MWRSYTPFAVMRTLLLCCLFSLALEASAVAAETPIPPAPTTWVTDNASFLSPETVSTLNERLRKYQQTTAHHVLVWIGTTTGDVPVEDWANNAFAKWKVGRKDYNDGLVLFIFSQDHKIRIEVGYGLEGQVTDAISSRIEHEIIVPRLRAGDHDGAVTGAVDALLATIGGEQGSSATPMPQANPSARVLFNVLAAAFVLLLFFLFFGLFASSRWWAPWLLYTLGSSSRGSFGGSSGSYGGGFFSGGDFSGGGFSGGGGYSGGGGMSGGGGATASW